MKQSRTIQGPVIALTLVFLGMLGVLNWLLLNPRISHAQIGAINVTTFHYDRQRTGWNSSETRLTPANVSSPQFGPLWNSQPFDSVVLKGVTYPPHLFATPLYIDTVSMTAGTYAGRQFSVVFAATTNNFVYAINAFDAPGTPAGTILWSTNLGTPTNFGLDGGVALGILGTPIIDLSAIPPRLYVAADCITNTPRDWKVFALDLGSGNILPGWPLAINDSTVTPINQNGPAKFQAPSSMAQRGALNLSPDGRLLYVPFGAYGDVGAGWMVLVDTATPSLASAFSGAPSSVTFANGGMWGSGGAALDLAGNVYDTTGNSPHDSADSPGVWGESLLVWPSTSPLRLSGTYTPWNYCLMDLADTDLGGSSPTIIPDLDPATTSTPHLVTFGSKQGNVYLVNRDVLPGSVIQRPPCSTNSAGDASLLPPNPQTYYKGAKGPLNVFGPYSETCTSNDNARMRTTPAYFKSADGTNYVFVSGAQKIAECNITPTPPGLTRLKIVTAPFQPAYLAVDATDTGLSLLNPGPAVLTSNGATNAIAWVLDANLYRTARLSGSSVPQPVLYALDATTMQRLWNSTPGQLNVGGKYNHATIARGVVFVGTDRIQAFGLAPDFTITASPASQTVTQGQSISYTASVTPSNGFTGPVTFSVSGLPTGVDGTFSPNPSTASSTLSVTASSTSPVGTYPITITGTSGSLTRTASATLIISAPAAGDFTLSVTPSSARLLPVVDAAAYTVTITRSGSFSGKVSFAVSGLPAGATGTFNPNPAKRALSMLIIRAKKKTAHGSYTLTITGTSGGLTHTTSATLVVGS